MKHLITLIFFLGVFALSAQAQTISPDSIRKLLSPYRGESPYAWLNKVRKVKNQLLANREFKNFAHHFQNQMGQANLSIGNRDSAYAHFAEATKRAGMRSSKFSKELFGGDSTQIEDALAYIVQQASQHRIVIISEAHYIGYHRLLTAKVLKALRAQGYSYFGAEMFVHGDSLSKRGYPVAGTAYSLYNDMYAGLMMRTAFREGYQMFPYEEEYKEVSDPIDSSFVRLGLEVKNEQQQRDWVQAVQIYKSVFEKDKNAKVILHAGYDHIREQPTKNWTPMIYYLKKLTGLEALTVGQHLEPIMDIADFQAFTAKMGGQDAFTVRNKYTQQPWFSKRYGNIFDIAVFTPYAKHDKFNSTHINYSNSNKPSHRIPLKNFKHAYPYLLQVFDVKEGEGQKDSPTALYEVEVCNKAEAQNTLKLYMPKDKPLKLRIISPTGKVLEEKKL